jgi:hypothetical protein
VYPSLAHPTCLFSRKGNEMQNSDEDKDCGLSSKCVGLLVNMEFSHQWENKQIDLKSFLPRDS